MTNTLQSIFTSINIVTMDPEISEEHCCDIDYLGFINKDKNIAFGIQIKPITAQENFGNYSVSERMKASFESFKNDYKGNVFILFSLDGEIANKQVIEDIKKEIERLFKLIS